MFFFSEAAEENVTVSASTVGAVTKNGKMAAPDSNLPSANWIFLKKNALKSTLFLW